MSLQDFFMMRAAQEHQNMLNSDNAGIVLQSLAQGVAKGLEEQQIAMREQRKAEEQQKKAMEQFSALEKSGYKIKRKITSSDGKISVSAEVIDPEQSKRDEIDRMAEERKQREQELRDFRKDFETTISFGGGVGDEQIKRFSEGLGADIKSQIEGGRGEAYYDDTGTRKWRILSQEEWAKKVNLGAFTPAEVDDINKISKENRDWNRVVDRLSEQGLTEESLSGAFEPKGTEMITTPVGVFSIPARFELAKQFADDPRYLAVARDLEAAFQSFRTRITGAQASDREIQRLREILPKLTDNPRQFFQSIRNLVANSEQDFNDRLDVYRRAGRNTEQFESLLQNRGGMSTGGYKTTSSGVKYKKVN